MLNGLMHVFQPVQRGQLIIEEKSNSILKLQERSDKLHLLLFSHIIQSD